MAEFTDERVNERKDGRPTETTHGTGGGTDGIARRTKRGARRTKAPTENAETAAAGGEEQSCSEEGAARRRRRGKGRGIDLLRQEVDDVMGRECKELAKSLLEKAKGGNVTSAKLLMVLAEGVKPAESNEKSRLQLLLERWDQEPEWEGDEDGLNENGMEESDDPIEMAE